jgi:chromosomal replication initiation ATPase DnaA
MSGIYVNSALTYTAKDMVAFKHSDSATTLGEYTARKKKPRSIHDPLLPEHIMKVCSLVTGADTIKIMSRNRDMDAVFSRYLTMYFMKKANPKLSLRMLGEIVGGKDHATALWGLRAVEDVIEVNSPPDRRTKWYTEVYNRLKEEFSFIT